MKNNRKIVTTSWDDGHPLDSKLFSILRKYKIKGTIYTPIKNQENPVLSNEELRKIAKDFEVGNHTFNHTVLTAISNEQIRKELLDSNSALEEIIGNKIISFCFPRGKYNKRVVDIVKNVGFKCARTAELFQTQHVEPFNFHTTVQSADRILLSKFKQCFLTKDADLAKKLLFSGLIFQKWDLIAKRTFDFVMENGGVWHLWGHSWETDKTNDWGRLQDVLEYVHREGTKNNAEFLTNGEIFD